MSTPPFETLADLHRASASLWIECQGCGRINTLTPHTLTGGKGGFSRPDLVTPAMAETIDAVKKRLRCSSCQSRDIDTRVMRRTF